MDFHMQEEFEDTKGVIKICISKKNRKHNGQKKKYKKWPTKYTYKTKERVTRTPLKIGWTQVFRKDKQFLLKMLSMPYALVFLSKDRNDFYCFLL